MAQINQIDERDASFLFPPTTINGLLLRRLSPTTYMILRSVKNPFVMSEPMPENHFRATLEWILVHTNPLPEVKAKAADLEAWAAFVDASMDEIPLAQVMRALPAIERELADIAAASVEVLPGKPPAPDTSPAG